MNSFIKDRYGKPNYYYVWYYNVHVHGPKKIHSDSFHWNSSRCEEFFNSIIGPNAKKILHNINTKPAMIFTTNIGTIEFKEFYKHGKLHCDFGPASINYSENHIRYFINGEYHKQDEFYYKLYVLGKITHEEYFQKLLGIKND